METSNNVTGEIFLEFLKCPTKAYFLAHGELPSETYFANVETEIALMFKLRALRMLQDSDESAKPLTFRQMVDNGGLATASHWFDSDTAAFDIALSRHGAAERRRRKSVVNGPIVPVVFSPWEKATLSDNLLLSFGALVLWQQTGIQSHANSVRCSAR